MSNNAVVSLPDGILDLDKLEELNLAGNKLKDLPKVRVPSTRVRGRAILGKPSF